MLLNYEDLILSFVKIQAPTLIVFLSLALILDFMRSMIFNNK